jgi:hypothetical protein
MADDPDDLEHLDPFSFTRPQEEDPMAQTQQEIAPNNPPLAEPRRVANPFGEAAPPARSNGAMMAAEQQREVAKVQAKLFIAATNPRNPIRAMEQITNDCCRLSLAEAATYTYQRGGSDIYAPTIRLAEVLAQRWGNIECGVEELSRHDGYSECRAYAWDLETNFTDEKKFQVRHWRDTQRGGYALKDERDIYEAIANFGARRKRAAMLAVIPGDVVEAALEQCERTMQARADTSPEALKRLADAFAEFDVTPAQIELRLGRRLEAIRPAQVVALRKIFNSLRDGMSEPADWFETPTVPLADPETKPAAEETKPADTTAPRRTRARRGNAETQSEPADKPSQAPASPEQPAPGAGGVPPAEPVNVGSQTVNPPADPGAAARRLNLD